jgi:hypothetical protein
VQSGLLVGLIGAPAAVLVGAVIIGAAVLRSWQVGMSDLSGKHAAPVSDNDVVDPEAVS